MATVDIVTRLSVLVVLRAALAGALRGIPIEPHTTLAILRGANAVVVHRRRLHLMSTLVVHYRDCLSVIHLRAHHVHRHPVRARLWGALFALSRSHLEHAAVVSVLDR